MSLGKAMPRTVQTIIPMLRNTFVIAPNAPVFVTGTLSTIDFEQLIFRIPAENPQMKRPIIIVGTVNIKEIPAPIASNALN